MLVFKVGYINAVECLKVLKIISIITAVVQGKLK